MTSKRGQGILVVNRWEAPLDLYEPHPERGPDARILTMPNIARPLHGRGMQPRTILGSSTWNHMRKKCYFDAGYKCEACGKDLGKGECHAHELFSTYWQDGYAQFIRCVCLCPLCHVRGIHSGRALTLYKQGNPLMTKAKLLEGAENLFKQLDNWNKEHPTDRLRAYDTWLDALKIDSLKDEMQALIDKYHVAFYSEDKKSMAKWGKWRVVVGAKEYPTPYKSEKDWKEAMEMASKMDRDRKATDPFTDPVYDELKKLLDNK